MNQPITTPKWWKFLAKALLIASSIVVLTSILSILAAITGAFSTYDFAGLFTYGIFFILLWYASLGLALSALLGIAIGILLKYHIKQYLIMFAICLIPTIIFDVTR